MMKLFGERVVVVAWDKVDGKSYVSVDMVRNKYDHLTAEPVFNQLRKTMGEQRYFFLLPYEQAMIMLEQEAQQDESVTQKNRRLIN